MTNQNSWRYGSAAIPATANLAGAGFFQQSSDDIFVGFHNRHPVSIGGMGGGICVAGPRSGKLRDVFAFNLCSGFLSGNVVELGPKAEGLYIAQDQTADGKYVISWNPSSLHNLPSHRINPLSHLTRDNPNLVAEIKAAVAQAIAKSGSPQGEYFELLAQSYAEAFFLTIAERDGVVTLPAVWWVINDLNIRNKSWMEFALLMHHSKYAHVHRIETEIENARKDNSGGYKGIIGELMKAFACLSDPVLMASVSPPFDFSFEELCRSDRTYHVSIMPPAEYITQWSSVIKLIFANAMAYKARAPQAPKQTWLIDEAPMLKKFPLLLEMYTYGAGIGIRPFSAWQSLDQMSELAPNARDILPASSAFQLYFGIRDFSSASRISDMMGVTTLQYDDGLQQSKARLAKQKAVQSLLRGSDPLQAGLELRHHQQAQHHKSEQRRPLMTPDEVLNMGDRSAILFADGLPGPALLNRRPYWEVSWMAGRYHPNPYHTPLHKVKCKGLLGSHWRKVVVRPVEPQFAHLPQYQSGIRSRIEK